MTAQALDWANLLDTIPEADTKPRDLIPPGPYTCVVDAAEAGESKTGNPKIELTFKVTEGEHANRKVWGRINFATSSSESMAITISQLGEFGITRQWLALNNPTYPQIAAKLLGKPITVRVSHREWNGQMYYDVRNFKQAAPTQSDSVPF